MAIRDVTEAHFLHQRSGLEPVFRPPVPQPTALAWIPGREELVACAKDGTVHVIDPVLGTRVIQTGIGEVSTLAIHPDRKRYFVITRDGDWILGRIGGGLEGNGKTGFLMGMEGFWIGEFAVMAGDTETGRQMIIISEGVEKGRIDLPARAIPIPGDNNKLLLARSAPSGLEIVKFGKNIAFSPEESTAHRLRAAGKHILGFTTTGVAIWERTGGQPRSMRLPDLTGGDINAAGTFLGLGTRSGAVALAVMNKIDGRARPHLVKAFDQPISAVAFSDRGRWLATGAEGLQVWTWEDEE